MDEPLGALDAEFRETMRAEIKRLHIEQHATSVYVTHDQIEAMAMGDRIVVMSDCGSAAGRHARRGLSQPGEFVRGAFHRQSRHESDCRAVCGSAMFILTAVTTTMPSLLTGGLRLTRRGR